MGSCQSLDALDFVRYIANSDDVYPRRMFFVGRPVKPRQEQADGLLVIKRFTDSYS
jgi:hypothetical protein